MRIAIIVVRTLIGLLFAFSAIVVLFNLVPQPVLTGKMKVFQDGIDATVYLMPLIKVIELLCGIAFIAGRFVPLASVVIFPVTVNIFLFSAFLAPENLPIAVFVLLGNLFLAYTCRKNYETIFAVK